ncbi:MAG: radical SAM protein [Myxococcales bacterium]|nr:radical SAM protein [Myxococcales bacterium]
MKDVELPYQAPVVSLPAREGEEVFHSYSRGLCPTCARLVDGTRLLRDGKVYLRKHCPEHGRSEALISGDADWWLKSLTYIKPGTVPHGFSTKVEHGCPSDCGLCPDHEQHSCLPIVEISNHCNLECPICIVENKNNWSMTVEELDRVLDQLVAKEGTVETVAFSGGEPTIHPRFLELVDRAVARPEISRVSVSTHGLRLATDDALCASLAEKGVYVALQLDGTSNDALSRLRGRGNHAKARQRTMAQLEKHGVRTTITATVARGVNDDQIGDLVRMLLDGDHVLSLTFQPAAYTGFGGGSFSHDPLDVLTIPDVVKAIDVQTGGLLKADDFLPLPCSHPSCFALTYLLKVEDDWIPFPRFLELDRYLQVVSNRGTLRPDRDLEDAIRATMDEMWTSAAQIPDCDRILGSLRKAILLMYPEHRALELTERLRIGEGLVKTVFVHAFMDVHTFEVERIKKCCTHYALPDGRLMPGCAYNNLYRGRDTRFAPAALPAEIWSDE